MKLALLKEDREKFIEDFKVHSNDTGSSVVQIALLTQKIIYFD